MPGTPTTKHSIATMAGTDAISTVDATHNSAMTTLDGIIAIADKGALAVRPTSTGGTPGKSGRFYYATDTGQLFFDHGTGWVEITSSTQLAALAASLEAVMPYAGVSSGGVVRRGKSIIATEEVRSSVSFGTLTTPDQVANVVLPTDGLLFVAFQALWKSSVSEAGLAALYLNSVAAKAQINAATPQVIDVGTGSTANSYQGLATSGRGLESGGANSTGAAQATTGQIVGALTADGFAGGSCAIFAAAGTYTVSVRFAAASGSVTVKDRKLWVWTMGF